MIQTIRVSSFLRFVLLADAATCVATGLLLALGAETVGKFLELPTQLLFYSGLSLLPFAAFVAFLGSRESVSLISIWTIIALNVLWTIDSILLLVSGWVEPNTLGYVFIVLQALAVGLLGALEYAGLRQSAANNFQNSVKAA